MVKLFNWVKCRKQREQLRSRMKDLKKWERNYTRIVHEIDAFIVNNSLERKLYYKSNVYDNVCAITFKSRYTVKEYRLHFDLNCQSERLDNTLTYICEDIKRNTRNCKFDYLRE